MFLYSSKRAPLGRLGNDLAHSRALGNQYVWVETCDNLYAGTPDRTRALRGKHPPTQKVEHLCRAGIRRGNIKPVRSQTMGPNTGGNQKMNERAAAAVNIPFGQNPKETIPYAPKPKEVRGDGDAVDRSGQAIVSLVQKAAETANANCDRAMDLAHKLSMQLRAAEDQLRAAEERIRELDLQMRHCQDRAQRAEQWLVRIYNDIEQKFFEKGLAPAEQAR